MKRLVFLGVALLAMFAMPAQLSAQKKSSDTSNIVRGNRNGFHCENYFFAGWSDRPIIWGGGIILEYKRFSLGAAFSRGTAITWKERYINTAGHLPIPSYRYYTDIQKERKLLAGYRIWENNVWGITVATGAAWKINDTYSDDSDYEHVSDANLINHQVKRGIAVQSEISLTGPNKIVGVGILTFGSFYKGYSSGGAAISLRVGFLR